MRELKWLLTTSMPLSVLIYLWIAQEAASNGKDPGFWLTMGIAVFMAAAVVGLGGLAWIMLRGFVATKPMVELDKGEVLLASVPANHWMGIEARGGRLFFTNRAIRFVSHAFNVQRDPVEIPWPELTETRSIYAGALQVSTSRHAFVFMVGDPDSLGAALIEAADMDESARFQALTKGVGVVAEQADRRVLGAKVSSR